MPNYGYKHHQYK